MSVGNTTNFIQCEINRINERRKMNEHQAIGRWAMKMTCWSAAALLAVAATTTDAAVYPVTANEDTEIDSSASTTSRVNEAFFTLRGANTGAVRAAFIRFDLPAIAANEQVTNVTLAAQIRTVSNNPNVLEVGAVTAPTTNLTSFWTTPTWDNAVTQDIVNGVLDTNPDRVNWDNVQIFSQTWTIGPSATTAQGDTKTYSGAGLTSYIGSVIGTSPTTITLLLGPAAGGNVTSFEFISTERSPSSPVNGQTPFYPTLTITTVVPEPSTLAIAAASAVLLGRRSRRGARLN